MDLFTYLMAKNGNNSSVHGDLFSYLLGKGQSQTQTISGVTIYIPDAKKLVSFMMTKESTQETTTGKNLFNKNNENNILNAYFGTSKTLLSGTNTKTLFINCKPNTTYTISRIGGTRLRVMTTSVLPQINVVGDDYQVDESATIFTVTTGSNASYLCVYYYSGDTDTLTEEEIRNSIQIEEGSTATPYEEYTGGIPSPNPDYPQEVNTVKGYRNLFDKNLFNEFTSSLQQIQLNLNPNTTYTMSSNIIYDTPSLANLFIHNSTTSPSTSVNGIYNDKIVSVTTNSDGILIIEYRNNHGSLDDYNPIEDFWYFLIEGTQQLPYVPYGNNYVNVEVIGKNLFDKSLAWRKQYLTSTGGTFGSNYHLMQDNYYEIGENLQYVLNFDWGNLVDSCESIFICYYDKNKTHINRIYYNKGIAATTPINTKYIRISWYNFRKDGNLVTTDIDNVDNYITNIQLELGSIATAYESYQEKNVPIPLNNNEIVGIGDYKDELKVDKSGHVFINKKTAKKVFDGSENSWILNNGCFQINSSFSPGLLSPSNTAYCTQYQYKYYPTNITSQLQNNEFGWNSSNALTIKDTRFNNVNDFKNALSTELPEFYYPATPEVIDLNTKVDLSLFKGANTITNSEGGYMTIEYR